MKVVNVVVNADGTMSISSIGTMSISSLSTVRNLRVRMNQLEGMDVKDIAMRVVNISRTWVRGSFYFRLFIEMSHNALFIEQATDTEWFWSNGFGGGSFDIDCWCIDCGGTEPGHGTGCTYMRDLHGQEANFGGLAQGGVLDVPKFLAERKPQGKGGSPSASYSRSFNLTNIADMLTQPFDTVDVRLKIPEGVSREDFLEMLQNSSVSLRRHRRWHEG